MTLPLHEYLELAKEAAVLGGSLDAEAFRVAAHRTSTKDSVAVNLVTETDRTTEAALRRLITSRYPDHRFMGEELGTDENAFSGPVWVLDPIDGTSNFVHGFPHYAVSVGLAIDGQMQVAACLDVERNEMFTAVLGGGAYLDGAVIHCAGRQTVSESLIITGFYYDRGERMERTLSAIRNLFGAGCHGIRRTGSAVLDVAWVAAGRVDAFFEYYLSPWDFGPAALIARESGALTTDINGTTLSLRPSSVVIANPVLLDEICAILKRS